MAQRVVFEHLWFSSTVRVIIIWIHTKQYGMATIIKCKCMYINVQCTHCIYPPVATTMHSLHTTHSLTWSAHKARNCSRGIQTCQVGHWESVTMLKHSETCPNPNSSKFHWTLLLCYTATLRASSFAMIPGPSNLWWCLMCKIKHEIACKCFKQSIRGRCWLEPGSVCSAKWPSNACGPHSESFQHSNASPPENNGIQLGPLGKKQLSTFQ